MERAYADGALVATAAGPPVERLAELFDTHYDRLYRLARRLAPGADDAVDIVQETFLRAARSLASVPAGGREEEAWLVRVLVNIRRDQWRRAAVEQRQLHALFRSARSENAGRKPETAILTRAAIWQALDRLPPRRRAIVVLHELEDMPIPAIASLLGIRAVTVRWHLSVARRELNRNLNAHLARNE